MSRLLSVFAPVVICSAVSSPADEQEKQPRQDLGWGTVTGRVIFHGMLDDPALQPYRQDVPIYGRLSIAESIRGVKPRLIAKVANETLIIDGRTRGIKNVIVYLRSKPNRVHPSFATDEPPTTAELVCCDRRFFPRALTLQVGQRLRLVSEETSDVANFKSSFIDNHNFNVLVQGGAAPFEWTPLRLERRVLPLPIKSTIQTAAIAWCLVTDHPYATVTDENGSFRLENLPAGQHELVVWHEAVGYVSKGLTVIVKPDEVHELDPQLVSVKRLRSAKQ